MNSEQLEALAEVVEYMLEDEQVHYNECETEGQHNHIYKKLLILNEFLEERKTIETTIKEILHTIKPGDIEAGCKRQAEQLSKLFN